MKNRTIWILGVVLIAVVFGAYFIMKEEAQAPLVTTSGGKVSGSNTDTQTNATSSPSTGGTSFNIYVVDIHSEDAPRTKNTIGCGDTLVQLKETITPTQGILQAALIKLFSIKERDVKVGTSTFYNALYQSNLKVESITITNGVATVKISGTTQLGGECDDPRVIAQIKQTVLQFSTIKQANIFINNKKLEDYFSLK
jgi:hypothetical protein